MLLLEDKTLKLLEIDHKAYKCAAKKSLNGREITLKKHIKHNSDHCC